MARCTNEKIFSKIGLQKIEQNTEVDFTIYNDMPDCKKIDAKKYIAKDGTVSYNRFNKPTNQFECMREGCVNSGTLYLYGTKPYATYKLQKDATEFFSGALAFYVKPSASATYPFSLSVTLSAEEALTNADVYTISITKDQLASDGYAAVVVDLASTPASETGKGWTASEIATYFKVSSDATLTADTEIGISSFIFLDSFDDFETTDVIKISCLSDNSGDIGLTALEQTCFESGYDTSTAPTIERTITGKAVTANFWKLNPMEGKGSATEGFDIATVEKTITATDDGKYGHILIADASLDTCGYFMAQLADNCDVTSAQLVQLTVPTLTSIDEGHFQLVRNVELGTVEFIFNKNLVGSPVLISYPQSAPVDEHIISQDNIGTRRVSMSYAYTQTDGTKVRIVANSVLVTNFPMGLSTDGNPDLSFTIAVQPDNDGYYYHVYRLTA